MDTSRPTVHSGNSSNKPFKAGKLKENKEFWLKLKLSQLVREWICEWVKVIFIDQPPYQLQAPKNRTSALRESDFVDSGIESLLETEAIVETRNKPHVVSPLSVAFGKKRRLILDLSWFNSFVVKENIEYEDMTRAIDILDGANFLATFDFESGYHHVSIHPSYQNYFTFYLLWVHLAKEILRI